MMLVPQSRMVFPKRTEVDHQKLCVVLPAVLSIDRDDIPQASEVLEGVAHCITGDVLSQHGNVGFPKAVNYGVLSAPSEWVLIWNTDAKPNFTGRQLMDMLDSLPKRVAFAAPAKVIAEKVMPLYDPEDIWLKEQKERVHAYVMMTDNGSMWVGMAAKQEKPWMNVGWSSYAPLFAVRREVFMKIGGYDLAYSPGYYEDADLWRRARALGHGTAIMPGLTYEHHGQGTFSKVYTEEQLAEIRHRNLERYLKMWRYD